MHQGQSSYFALQPQGVGREERRRKRLEAEREKLSLP